MLSLILKIDFLTCCLKVFGLQSKNSTGINSFGIAALFPERTKVVPHPTKGKKYDLVHLGLCVFFGLTDEISALDSTPFLHQSGMEVHETA